jgi:hypothetical protein
MLPLRSTTIAPGASEMPLVTCTANVEPVTVAFPVKGEPPSRGVMVADLPLIVNVSPLREGLPHDWSFDGSEMA